MKLKIENGLPGVERTWQYRDCTDSYVIVTRGASFDTGHYVCLLYLGE